MKTLLALAAGALIAVPALAQKMDNADQAALKQLAQANLAEIKAGQMGAQKATNPEVKKFAQKMADDHQIMLNDLKTLAKSKDVALPQDPNARDFVEMKKLEHVGGADFDKSYMDQMVKDHEKDLQSAQNIAAKAKDAQFKSAVQHAASKMQEHLSLAKTVQGKVSAAAAGSTGK
jgi:putative membrane protein